MARRFNDTSDLIDMGNVLAFERTDKFSMGGWFFPDSGAGAAFLIAKQDNDVDGRGYSLEHDASGRPRAVLINAAGTNQIDVTGRRDMRGHYHHLILTYDGSSVARGVKLYLDGILEPLTIAADNLSATMVGTESFRFGAREGATVNLYGGLMADIAVWSGIELTAQDILSLYRNAAPRQPALTRKNKLAGYWTLDGFDSPEKDLSGSGFDGALTGTTRAAHPNRRQPLFLPAHLGDEIYIKGDTALEAFHHHFLKGDSVLQALASRYMKGDSALAAVREFYIRGDTEFTTFQQFLKGETALIAVNQMYLRGDTRFTYSAVFLKGDTILRKKPVLDDLGDNPPPTKAGLISRQYLSLASVKKEVT